MAKFCGRCGSRLDEKTGLCPNCDKRPVRRHRRTMTAAVVLILVVTLLLGVLGTGLLLYFKQPREPEITEYTYSPPAPENIVIESGLGYIDNELLIYLESSDDRARLEEALVPLQGEIVGEIPVAAHYQVRFSQARSQQELQDLAQQLRELPIVRWVNVNCAVSGTGAFYPDDKEWKNEWDSVPGDSNWALEVMDAPDAWEHLDEMTPVRVGVYDGMFDTGHKDLHFAKTPLGNASAIENRDWDDHGTHVAGTIAATFHNGRGVCGVAPRVELYGVADQGISVIKEKYALSDISNTFADEIALTNLIFVNDCRVVNISLGFDSLAFNASRGNTCAVTILDIMSESLSMLLEAFLDSGKDFIICTAAGNQNDPNGGYRYYLKDEYNDPTESAYYSHDDYLAYLHSKNPTSEYEIRRNAYFDRHRKDYNIPISEGGRMDAGYVGAEFDYLGAISNPRVASRILVVGAVGNNGTHQEGGGLFHAGETVYDGCFIAPYSQGGWRVNIMAPGGAGDGKGHEIYSTVRGGYGYNHGTSMASPHVAGAAALVLSVRPDLTGEEVIDILLETAVGVYDGAGLVNAGAAVEKALGRKIPKDAVELNGHYYYLYSLANTDADNIMDIEYFCEELGGHLATISSQEENDFLFRYMGQQQSGGAYFGLTDAGSEGRWYWVNGEDLTYTNWAPNEPNGQNENEDYAMFYYKYADGGWNDGDFSGNAQFLCEWDSAS